MFEDKCVWSALYPSSNHSHIRQLQFATHAFSQQVLQQAVQISICQWLRPAAYISRQNGGETCKFINSDFRAFCLKKYPIDREDMLLKSSGYFELANVSFTP